jgi:phage shock protein PspC (stress-responsive transcriptional regulator)
VADKCLARTGSTQKPVTLADLEPVLEEIGSVQDAGAPDPAVTGGPRRLEQVSEGAILSGVCLGIARYFGVDVTLVRVIAVLLLIFSGGTMILVYAVLMLLLPFAPLQRSDVPVRKIPRKSREFVEFLRSKVSTAAG